MGQWPKPQAHFLLPPPASLPAYMPIHCFWGFLCYPCLLPSPFPWGWREGLSYLPVHFSLLGNGGADWATVSPLRCISKWGWGWGVTSPLALGSWRKCLPSLKLSFEYCDLVFILKCMKSNPTTTAFSPFFHFVANPSLFSSFLFLQYSAIHAHFIFFIAFFFLFLRDLKSWSFFSAEYILYIIYI